MLACMLCICQESTQSTARLSPNCLSQIRAANLQVLRIVLTGRSLIGILTGKSFGCIFRFVEGVVLASMPEPPNYPLRYPIYKLIVTRSTSGGLGECSSSPQGASLLSSRRFVALCAGSSARLRGPRARAERSERQEVSRYAIRLMKQNPK